MEQQKIQINLTMVDILGNIKAVIDEGCRSHRLEARLYDALLPTLQYSHQEHFMHDIKPTLNYSYEVLLPKENPEYIVRVYSIVAYCKDEQFNQLSITNENIEGEFKCTYTANLNALHSTSGKSIFKVLHFDVSC
jgi:hypothetical protein